jgi:hypothetical protein
MASFCAEELHEVQGRSDVSVPWQPTNMEIALGGAVNASTKTRQHTS